MSVFFKSRSETVNAVSLNILLQTQYHKKVKHNKKLPLKGDAERPVGKT